MSKPWHKEWWGQLLLLAVGFPFFAGGMWWATQKAAELDAHDEGYERLEAHDASIMHLDSDVSYVDTKEKAEEKNKDAADKDAADVAPDAPAPEAKEEPPATRDAADAGQDEDAPGHDSQGSP